MHRITVCIEVAPEQSDRVFGEVSFVSSRSSRSQSRKPVVVQALAQASIVVSWEGDNVPDIFDACEIAK